MNTMKNQQLWKQYYEGATELFDALGLRFEVTPEQAEILEEHNIILQGRAIPMTKHANNWSVRRDGNYTHYSEH